MYNADADADADADATNVADANTNANATDIPYNFIYLDFSMLFFHDDNFELLPSINTNFLFFMQILKMWVGFM